MLKGGSQKLSKLCGATASASPPHSQKAVKGSACRVKVAVGENASLMEVSPKNKKKASASAKLHMQVMEKLRSQQCTSAIVVGLCKQCLNPAMQICCVEARSVRPWMAGRLQAWLCKASGVQRDPAAPHRRRTLSAGWSTSRRCACDATSAALAIVHPCFLDQVVSMLMPSKDCSREGTKDMQEPWGRGGGC